MTVMTMTGQRSCPGLDVFIILLLLWLLAKEIAKHIQQH